MIGEIGHFCLIVALMLALAQGILPLVGAQQGRARALNASVRRATASTRPPRHRRPACRRRRGPRGAAGRAWRPPSF